MQKYEVVDVSMQTPEPPCLANGVDMYIAQEVDAEIARLKAEIAERDQRISEIAHNCPSCGRHDFGLWQPTVNEFTLDPGPADPQKLDCESLEQMIDEIPGDDGWWKSSARDAYLENARHLVSQGMSNAAAVAMLDELYWAATECFGS